jgi:hypothetical protein
MPPVSVPRERIDRVLADPDAVRRNRWITQTYWELAEPLRRVFPRDGTWLSFAVWASSSAGRLIPPGATLDLLAEGPQERAALSRVKRVLDALGVGRAIDAVARSVSDHTADGNRLVFAELAPLFAQLGDALSTAPPARAGAVAWPASAAPALTRALGRYLEAASSRSDDERAELILLANLEIVLHEQRRLDGAVRRALDAVVLDGLLPLLFDGAPAWLPARLAGWLRTPGSLLHSLVTRVAERFATDALLTLRIHRKELVLSQDVRARGRGRALFPPDLSTIESPELQKFLAHWDQTGGTGIGSGAENWADLTDRMNFICTLFRSQQQEPELLAPPFRAAAQLQRVRAGP